MVAWRKLILILFSVFILGFYADTAYSGVTRGECARDSDCRTYYNELKSPNFEILREIRDNYVDEIAFEELMKAFRVGGLEQVFSLLDPHSMYITAAEKAKQEERMSFGGTGLKVRVSDKQFIVAGFAEDSPAMRSGKIQKGDIVIAVGGKSTKDVPTRTMIGWIRGEIGEEVVIKFRREAGDAKPVEFSVTLKREVIKVEIVSSQIFGDAGYIDLRVFDGGVAGKIYEAISKFPKNINGLVIDFRGNPGGRLDEANKVGALFLERNRLMEKIITRGEPKRFFAGFSRPFWVSQVTLPLVILVDGFSASGSEIVAAGLQDHKRAVVIGRTPTFGKALMQTAYGLTEEDEYWWELLKGDYFKITTGRIYRPNGKSLQGKGVIPDIIVEDGGGDDIEKMMRERGISESKLERHLKGEEESMLTPEEKARFEVLKEDRQLYTALEVLKILQRK